MSLIAAALLLAWGGAPPGDDREPLPLGEVRRWAYQIQDLEAPGSAAALAASTYDLLVLEPTRTEREQAGFSTRDVIAKLKGSPAGDGVHRKRILAYIDIGEAEEGRWYWTWSKEWKKGKPKPADWPKYIITPDPDGWEGDFPVAFWDPEWKDIVLHGKNHPPAAPRDFTSVVDEVLKDGFDGVYLDWVEAYEEKTVAAAATKAGRDPAREMVAFIGEIRALGRAKNPAFLVIQQNGSKLARLQPEIFKVVDGIAQEDLYYSGKADSAWEDPKGHDQAQEAGLTQEWIVALKSYQEAGKPVFTVDYTVDHAAETYKKARELKFIPYCSRVSLSRLTTTPPPGP